MQTQNNELSQQPQGRLLTKRAFAQANPGFLTLSALSWLLFKHMTELRACGAVLKIGKKQLFIDEAALKAWVRDKALQDATTDGVYDNGA